MDFSTLIKSVRPTGRLPSWRRRAVAALGLAWFLAAAAHAQTMFPVKTDDNSGITIQVTDIYNGVPGSGYLPLHVSINNASNGDGVWNVSTQSSSVNFWNNATYVAQATCAVPAHQTRVFEVLAPIGSGLDVNDPSSVALTVRGPRVVSDKSEVRFSANLQAVPQSSLSVAPPASTAPPAVTPPAGTATGRAMRGRGARRPTTSVNKTRQAGPPIFVGLSPTLSRDLGDTIKNYLNAICLRPIQQSSLDPAQLSADWRAYLGFDMLVYTAADWLAAPPGVRLAITQWVAVGGELRLIADSDAGLDLPPRQGELYGEGFLELFTENDLNLYDFTVEHKSFKERFLFNPRYRPKPDVGQAPASEAIPAGFARREYTMKVKSLGDIINQEPYDPFAAIPDDTQIVEEKLRNYFEGSNVNFPPGSSLHYDAGASKIIVTDTKRDLDALVGVLGRYGESFMVEDGVGPPLPTPPKNYDDVVPRLDSPNVAVAIFIILFALLIGPLNLFWFCQGRNRPRLLWVTPVLALATSLVIVIFILLAEGLGGHGVYYRITLLMPDGKYAVEEEIESSVTGVLLHRDFDLPNFSWVSWDPAHAAPDGSRPTVRGVFTQVGSHYSGDWFASRREQSLSANSVVPSRAALHLAPSAPGQPPVLTSEYNDWMQNLFYVDNDGHYWKTARISDGQPTPLQPATVEEFDAAWTENLLSAPAELYGDLNALTPRPGTFFALGNGGNSALEPALPHFVWTRFRHIIIGPVTP